MTNDGQIRAAGANALVLNPGAPGTGGAFVFRNNGVLQADFGGALTLLDGTYENNSAITAQNGGVVNINSNAVIDGGQIVSNGSGVVNANAGADFTGVETVNGTDVTQGQGQSVEIRSGLQNNGVWTIASVDSTFATTDISFVGDQDLAGTGRLVFSDDPHNRLVASSSTLTNLPMHTIEGAGQVLVNSGGLVNRGTVRATGTNALVVDPGGTVGDVFVNDGVLEAVGAGGLSLQAGRYQNNTAIRVGDGSVLNVNSTAVVEGGELRTDGSGVILANAGADFTGVRLVGGSRARQRQSQNVEIRSGLTNDGVWEVLSEDSSAATTDLSFVGDQSLVGGGEVFLSDDPQNRLLANGSFLAHGASHTIRGSGQILANSGGLENQGTMRATGDNALVLDPGVEGFINNGIIRAEGLGGLSLNGGVYTNNTSIEVLADSRLDINSSAVVAGGALQSAGTGVIFPNSGSDLTGVSVSSGSTVVQNQSQAVEIRSGLVNDAVWRMDSSDSSAATTDLSFVGSQMLSGSGEFLMNDDAGNRVLANGSVLTQAAGHTIRGAGSILLNNGGIINEGSILAQGGTALVIDPGVQGFVNDGVVRAEGGGGLLLQGGVYDNNTAIEVANGSQLRIGSSAVIEGGRLTSTGSGVILPLSGADLTGVNVTSGSRVVQSQSQPVEIRQGLVNDAVWEVNSVDTSSGITDLSFVGSQALSGGGEIVFSDDPQNRILAQGVVLTQATDHTIRGAGSLLANNGGIINNGSILAQGANALGIDPGVQGFVNNGTLRAEGPGGLNLFGGVYENLGDTIEVASGSVVRVFASAEIRDGTLSGSGSGVFEALNGADFTRVTVAAGTLVRQGQSQPAEIRGGLVNNGRWEINSVDTSSGFTDLSFVGEQAISGSGQLVLADDPQSRILSAGAVLTNAAGHTIRGAGRVLANSGGLANRGAILATGANSLFIDAGVEGFNNLPGGILGGDSTVVLLDPSVVNDGRIAPGLTPGAPATFGISGNLSNNVNAITEFELGNVSSDAIAVTGSYQAGGVIDLRQIAGFSPLPSDVFTLVTATSGINGVYFNAVPAMNQNSVVVSGQGLTGTLVYNPGSIQLTNVIVTDPNQACSRADFTTPFGTLNGSDVQAFITLLNMGDPRTDFTTDGSEDIFDTIEFLRVFDLGCP
ncbi:MAG: hypothetical protein AAFQ71_13230 [Planctomycetota bacterium]